MIKFMPYHEQTIDVIKNSKILNEKNKFKIKYLRNSTTPTIY
jgi:hypothetical protein